MTHTMIDENTGTPYDLTGETLQAIADQAKALTENGCDLSGGKIYKDNGELVGFVSGDGTWRYA
jgi:hypothetical protein